MNLEEQKFLQAISLRIRTRWEAMMFAWVDLGEGCDLDRTFIGSVERGERNLALLDLRKIAQLLRVALTAFLAEKRLSSAS